MSEQGGPIPKDPPVPVETPESRMTGEGAPPPGHEEEKGPDDGPEYAVTEPAHDPEPHEPPD
ncbi:hypothetical protein [Streptomyces sp. LS1784]|uniref:hypothetical protein n=1 Tax=Streptomyces sp. LS1784 TaxID=2851533 RepID=UPI001CCA0DCD|nr:hypothetical protein [Streptomyces sp. LS1784]